MGSVAKRRWLVLLISLTFIGCPSDDKTTGSEGGSCYPNGTCNAGLVCISNQCVRSPDVSTPRLDKGLIVFPDLDSSIIVLPDIKLTHDVLPVHDTRAPDSLRVDSTPLDSKTCTSLGFSGATKVVITNTASLDLGTSLSLIAWVFQSTSAEHLLFDTGLSGSYCGPFGLKIFSDGKVGFGVRGGQGSLKCDPQVNATSVGAVATNKWVHVAVVYDSTTVKIYIDGQLDSTLTVTPVDPYAPVHDLWLGWEDGPHSGLIGAMSGAQLWSRALSSTEVTAAMAASVSNTTGLVGSWPMNEGSSNTAHDISGSGNNGTISGGTWTNHAPGCP